MTVIVVCFYFISSFKMGLSLLLTAKVKTLYCFVFYNPKRISWDSVVRQLKRKYRTSPLFYSISTFLFLLFRSGLSPAPILATLSLSWHRASTPPHLHYKTSRFLNQQVSRHITPIKSIPAPYHTILQFLCVLQLQERIQTIHQGHHTQRPTWY